MIKTFLAIVLTINMVIAVYAYNNPKLVSAVCPTPDSTYGKLESTVNIPSNNRYALWVRIKASRNTDYLKVNIDSTNTCNINMGSPAVNETTWTWVNTKSDNSAVDVDLTAGNLAMVFGATADNVKLDSVLFAQDLACIPVSSGSNCRGTNTNIDTNTGSPQSDTEDTDEDGIVDAKDDDDDNDGINDTVDEDDNGNGIIDISEFKNLNFSDKITESAAETMTVSSRTKTIFSLLGVITVLAVGVVIYRKEYFVPIFLRVKTILNKNNNSTSSTPSINRDSKTQNLDQPIQIHKPGDIIKPEKHL